MLPKSILVNEIMWEYNCNRKKAENLVEAYQAHDEYKKLCNIVMYKRVSPDFSMIGGVNNV